MARGNKRSNSSSSNPNPSSTADEPAETEVAPAPEVARPAEDSASQPSSQNHANNDDKEDALASPIPKKQKKTVEENEADDDDDDDDSEIVENPPRKAKASSKVAESPKKKAVGAQKKKADGCKKAPPSASASVDLDYESEDSANSFQSQGQMMKLAVKSFLRYIPPPVKFVAEGRTCSAILALCSAIDHCLSFPNNQDAGRHLALITSTEIKMAETTCQVAYEKKQPNYLLQQMKNKVSSVLGKHYKVCALPDYFDLLTTSLELPGYVVIPPKGHDLDEAKWVKDKENFPFNKVHGYAFANNFIFHAKKRQAFLIDEDVLVKLGLIE